MKQITAQEHRALNRFGKNGAGKKNHGRHRSGMHPVPQVPDTHWRAGPESVALRPTGKKRLYRGKYAAAGWGDFLSMPFPPFLVLLINKHGLSKSTKE